MATIRPGIKGFKDVGEVAIFFFANGLMIKGMPFYPYYSKQAQVSVPTKYRVFILDHL